MLSRLRSASEPARGRQAETPKLRGSAPKNFCTVRAM